MTESTPDPLVRAVISAAAKQSMGAGTASAAVGRAAHALLRARLKGVYEPGGRRTLRAESLASLVDHLGTAGLPASVGELGRSIQIHHVNLLFGKHLPLVTTRAFCRCLRRDAKKEEWSIRPKIEDDARAIWARAVDGLAPAAVADQIAALFPPSKPRKARAKPDPVKLVLLKVASLDARQQRAVHQALGALLASKTGPDVVPLSVAQRMRRKAG